MISRGVMKNLMDRIETVYKETGGKKEEDIELEEEETKGLSKFDMQKLIVAKKIAKTKENILKRDELIEKGKGRTTEVKKLANDIRMMRKNIDMEVKKLDKIQKTGAKGGPFKKPNPIRVQKEKEDVELIQRHSNELRNLDMKRFKSKRKGRKNQQNNPDQQKLLEGADDDSNPQIGGSGGGAMVMKNLVREQDLDDPSSAQNLPEIDIEPALKKLEEMRKKVDEGLDKIADGLDELGNVADDINDAVDKSLQQLNTIEEKVDDKNEKLIALKEDVEKKITQTSNTVIYVIIIVGLIFVIGGLIGGYIGISYVIDQLIPKV